MGARFVRLGIAGFKSFADATSIEILPGLTGVVGPNGCGKSNVAEALRWAMGEANVRHLRGGEMDDVIFAGTANRPSRNLAEVSLHIEADDTALPAPFTDRAEVQVVRRIERGAGSTYRVDGREARARDVQTLFADLASGARSSAMVSQGRVGALVNARPEERRSVLEEAAGITGLHARRAEAETRLRAAEANLERAEERRALLQTQLAGLQVQSRQAARYRTVMEAALETEAALLGMQRARAMAACEEAEAALRSACATLSEATDASARLDAAASIAQNGLPALRETEAEARTGLERARLAQEGVAAEAARAASALAGAVQRQAQLARDVAHAEAALHEAARADERLVEEARRVGAEAEAHPAVLEAARQQAETTTAALRSADLAAAEASAAAAEAVARAGALQQVTEQAEARARRAQEAGARLEAERARVSAGVVAPERLAAAITALQDAERARAAAQAAQAEAEAARLRATPAAVGARETHAQLEAARYKLAAETAALTEILSVRDGERWPPMVDRLTVPTGLEVALGAVLGEELGAAENPDAPRHWRPLPARPVSAPPSGQSFAELVDAPSLLGRALAGVGLVASDAEGDAGQLGLAPGQCLVSEAGGVWRWDGYTVRAGTPTAAAVRLRQRNRLSHLQARLTDAERDEAAARLARDQTQREEREALAAEQQAGAARRGAETATERARTDASQLRAQADAAAARMAALDDQAAQLAPEAESARAALQTALAVLRGEHDPASLRAAADRTRAAVATARAAESAAARALDAVQRAEQARTARAATIGREREDRRMRAADLAARVKDLGARAYEAEAEHRTLAAAPDRAARERDLARAAVAAAEAGHHAAASARQAAERDAETAAGRARAAEHAGFAAREAVARIEGARDAALQARDVTEARIAERDGVLPPLPAPQDSSAAAEDRLRNRLQRLVRERDDIGPVNLRAEIEARTLEDEVAGIVRDRAELETAIAKLRGSIGHLNREGRERLSAVFQQVDRHFQALFGRMFGGGRAHLALVGSDDPLQAGLEIYAQPPGKKLAALSLLSGGEQALTALSLIFAVFRCNPAPLCVLDEVDAPLDDANVERFCALLADMVQETGTRFLVVTHHQVTMTRMDRLYGVTMQERGVSRLLSVDLARAAGMVEAIAAE